MFCSKCGCQNTNGEKFCKNCGVLLENKEIQNTITNQINPNVKILDINNNSNNNENSSNTLSQETINKSINPNMKKWAILSIIVPVAGIIWYWFIGLSFYLAIIISAAGFSFAEKGKMADKRLATIGKICNWVLTIMAIIVLIINIINNL